MLSLREATEANIGQPNFVQTIESNNGVNGGKVPNVKSIIEEVFEVAVERGLNNDEFSLLLRFFCKGCFGVSEKCKLLRNIVPTKKAPAAAIRQFMAWFISHYVRLKRNMSVCCLQWIIGLLEYNLADPKEIDYFYYDLLKMISVKDLVPYAGKLLCKLTKPVDVTNITVTFISEHVDPQDKILLAVLNVFHGYKPNLMTEDVKRVDINKILLSVSQRMDYVMKVRAIQIKRPVLPARAIGISEVPMKNVSYFKEDKNYISALIPLPTYSMEGLSKFGPCYPTSLDQAFREFNNVPIPQSVMSLMRDEVGFFTLIYQRIELQTRFSDRLLQTLQNVLIYQEVKSSEDDQEFLLSRCYWLQTFMRQSVPCISIFLSGYLINWDGVEHRHNILNLIEWATFHSYKDLATNILRPLHLLFVSYNVTMKRQIIQAVTNLIKNMLSDIQRSQEGLTFPFTKRGPKWVKEPMSMLAPLVRWLEELIQQGLCLEPEGCSLLLEAIHFYETMNMVESESKLPMFTIVSQGVVLHSLTNLTPNAIIRICRLLLRYHKEFLPQVRVEQPQFYEQCKEKISRTSSYARQIIFFLLNSPISLLNRENRINPLEISDESFLMNVDHRLDLSSNFSFALYLWSESTDQRLSLHHSEHRIRCYQQVAVHLKDVIEFVSYFSPQRIPEVS